MSEMGSTALSLLELTKEEYSKLPKEFAALLAVACHTGNEIRVVQGIYLSAYESKPSDEHALQKWRIHTNTLARLLSAKSFEAIDGISGFRKRLEKSRSRNIALLKEISTIWTEIEILKNLDGYAISKFLRDYSTNHSLPARALEFLPHGNEKFSKKLYFHRHEGDSFFPFGEATMFDCAIEDFAKQKDKTGTEVFLSWLDWTLKASRQMTHVLNTLSMHLVQDILPEKRFSEVIVHVEDELSLTALDSRIPLFFTGTLDDTQT
ncbi:hypothetical protein [Antarctobacter sp.]|uniref:hypothetical protein n=1 Tax=Antarctobacter sp. TaxID=1872577 RepID=UPI003A901C76